MTDEPTPAEALVDALEGADLRLQKLRLVQNAIDEVRDAERLRMATALAAEIDREVGRPVDADAAHALRDLMEYVIECALFDGRMFFREGDKVRARADALIAKHSKERAE